MAIVILGAVAVFFLILLNKGSEYISMRLRFFIIPPILLMLISGYVLLLVQGNAVSTLDTKFAADSSKFLVSKAVMDNGDLESLITAYNKTIDEDQILRFVVMTAGDGTTFIGDHNASKGNMSTPTLLFMLMGTLLVLPFAFGAFIIVDKRVEGIKTFFSYFFICIFVLICMLPVIWIILASFFSEADIKGIVSIINKGEFFTKNFFTLANYEKNLSGGFLTYFKNSLVVSGVTACFCGILGVIAGYAFSRFQFPGRKKQLMWILISQLFPMAMMIVPLYIVSQLLGLSEGLLIIIIAYSATSLPFSIWMMKGYFDTIPIDIEEAAAIDGASTIGRLWHILLPLARPAIATTIFYSFITAWNEFAIASFFLNDDKLRTLPVALNAMLDNFNPQYALFSSAGVLSSLPVVLLFIYLQKHLVSGLTAGGVKG